MQTSAARDAVFTIAPSSWSRSRGPNARMPCTTPMRLIPTTHSQSASGPAHASCGIPPTPALLHTTCAVPNRSKVAAASSSTEAASATSVTTASTSAPCSRNPVAARSSAPTSTSASTSRIPAPANASANAIPIPPPPPVTTATLPSRCSTILEARTVRVRRGCVEDLSPTFERAILSAQVFAPFRR